tara:strand:+ start:775 stop:1725 length:951 start_codon:yes stop_codon:yes gene_type:complete
MSIFDNKTVLVTGAAGICGHSAIKKLLQCQNVKIRATIFNTRKIMIEHPNIEVVKTDLSSYEECKKIVSGVDIVLNFAAFIRGAKGQEDSKIDLVRNNIVPTINMLDAAVREGVEYFGFVGSSTMYPAVDYPVKEEELFDGEPFNSYMGVGWMKRYSQKVIEHFQEISNTKFGVVVPMAIYGPHDNFNEHGHAVPQLIMKASNGMSPFEIWGDGKQVRQFVFVDDLVDALFFVLQNDPSGQPYNVSTGVSTTITELVEEITRIYGYQPKFNYDLTKPVMIPKRQINIEKITNLGWKPTHTLSEGLEKTIEWYEKNK